MWDKTVTHASYKTTDMTTSRTRQWSIKPLTPSQWKNYSKHQKLKTHAFAWNDVNISLAFLHWVGIALHLWPFVSDIAVFVLKGDVKLQLTNCCRSCRRRCTLPLVRVMLTAWSCCCSVVRHRTWSRPTSTRRCTAPHGRVTTTSPRSSSITERTWSSPTRSARLSITALVAAL